MLEDINIDGKDLKIKKKIFTTHIVPLGYCRVRVLLADTAEIALFLSTHLRYLQKETEALLKITKGNETNTSPKPNQTK